MFLFNFRIPRMGLMNERLNMIFVTIGIFKLIAFKVHNENIKNFCYNASSDCGTNFSSKISRCKITFFVDSSKPCRDIYALLLAERRAHHTENFTLYLFRDGQK